MRALLLTAALSMAVTVGCATKAPSFHASRLSLLNIGMTKEQVLQVLGRPQQAGTASDGIEVFRYVQVGGRVGETSCYGVIFKNGEVTDYGLETGVRLGGHYAIHELFSSDWHTNFAAPKP